MNIFDDNFTERWNKEYSLSALNPVYGFMCSHRFNFTIYKDVDSKKIEIEDKETKRKLNIDPAIFDEIIINSFDELYLQTIKLKGKGVL